jgi:xylulokinase
MDCYLGIDVGTSGVKVIILDKTGKLLAKASREYSMEIPADGWAQQDPDLWWNNTKSAIREAASGLGSEKDIRAIGLSAQMLGAVFLDKSGKSIRPCLIWCDQRSSTERDALEKELTLEYILEKTGNYPLTGYWLPKLKWLEKKEPENYDKIDKVIFPKDYIRFMLTGEFVTEVADGGGSSLFDVARRQWSWDLIDRVGFPRNWFVKVVESDEITGKVRREVADEIGIPAGTPVVGGGGDQLAGGIGNGIVEEGIVSSTIGTSGVVFACTDSLKIDYDKRGLHCFCHSVRDKWSVFGCTLAAGGSYKWIREQLAGDEERYARKTGIGVYDVMDLLASKSPVGSKGLIFLPYMIGERTPYPDPYAKGVFFGLSLRHNRGDMIRSVMEGVTFSLRDSMEILHGFGVTIKQVRASGGGGKSSLWRQMQADIFNTELITLNIDEGPALGASILAMVGAGAYKTVKEACDVIIRPVHRQEPIPENVRVYEESYGIYRSLYPALKDVFAAHSAVKALV